MGKWGWDYPTRGKEPIFMKQRSSRAYALTVVCFAVLTVSGMDLTKEVKRQLNHRHRIVSATDS